MYDQSGRDPFLLCGRFDEAYFFQRRNNPLHDFSAFSADGGVFWHERMCCFLNVQCTLLRHLSKDGLQVGCKKHRKTQMWFFVGSAYLCWDTISWGALKHFSNDFVVCFRLINAKFESIVFFLYDASVDFVVTVEDTAVEYTSDSSVFIGLRLNWNNLHEAYFTEKTVWSVRQIFLVFSHST